MKNIILGVALVVISQLSYASSTHIKNYLNSSSEFEALIEKESTAGRLPRIEDSASLKVFNQLSNSQKAITSETYSVDDLGVLLNVCGKANQFNMTYMLHGMNSMVDNTESPQALEEKLLQLMSENSIKFQNELYVFFPFVIDCIAIQSPLILTFWESLPIDQQTQVRKDGIIQVRSGILNIYAGAFISLRDSEIELAFSEALLESVTQAAPNMASILSLDSRGVVLNMVSEYSIEAPEKYMDKLGSMSRDFGSKECNTICQL